MRARRRSGRPWSTVLADARRGILIGWMFASLFSLWVLLLSLLRGSTQFDKYGMSAWGIIATYFAAGTLGGVLVGLLRPIASSRVGGTVVGALTGILVYGAINVAMDGWSGFDWRFALIAGVPVGGFIGYRFSGQRW